MSKLPQLSDKDRWAHREKAWQAELPILLRCPITQKEFPKNTFYNYSSQGIGLLTDEHVEPGTKYYGKLGDIELEFLVIHSTFMPGAQNFRTGLKAISKEVDLKELFDSYRQS